MIKVNCIGDACPIPVVKTKKAIEALEKPEDILVSVDNTVACENIRRLVNSYGYKLSVEKVSDSEYTIAVAVDRLPEKKSAESHEECHVPSAGRKTVVVISKDHMGEGDEKLGKTLLKGFIYALTQQESLPSTMLFYNSGAFLTTEGSESITDLRTLENLGVEILTCGTCLNNYGIQERLLVGSVTNMYVITEKLIGADSVVKP